MLVLTRRTNESIIITDGNNDMIAQIFVTNINKNQAKIGIDTLADYKIWRKEVYERMFKNEQPNI